MQPAVGYPGLTGDGARRLREGAWRVAVVGAGGWIGLAALEQLQELFGPSFPERVFAFGSNRRLLALRGGRRIEQRPLTSLIDLPPAPTLVLHLAFLTQEKAGLMSHERYTAINEQISGEVFAALGPIGATGVFVASSGAVEMVGQPGADPNKAIYGRLKLDDEARFAAWAEQTGRRAVNVRIFGLSGPYINKLNSYALSCFITDVLRGRPISIQADRPVFRSYVAVDEMMSIVFGLLTDGTSGAITFDTGADRGYEMAEIAQDVAAALGHTRGVLRPPFQSDAADRYVGDGTVYAELRRRLNVETIDFQQQVVQTARYMAELPFDGE